MSAAAVESMNVSKLVERLVIDEARSVTGAEMPIEFGVDQPLTGPRPDNDPGEETTWSSV
jgi:hypothetical protein